MFHKLKILFVGPCESGKTVLANFLADATETATGDYKPTQGARILEFEIEGNGKSSPAEVELWDCSGNHSFEMCWPAVQKNTNGVVFVFNPSKSNHERELENWYLHFAKELGIKDKQCVVFAHRRPGFAEASKKKLGGTLSRLKVVHTNLDDDPDAIRDEFQAFIGDVSSTMSDRREQEELSIIE